MDVPSCAVTLTCDDAQTLTITLASGRQAPHSNRFMQTSYNVLHVVVLLQSLVRIQYVRVHVRYTNHCTGIYYIIMQIFAFYAKISLHELKIISQEPEYVSKMCTCSVSMSLASELNAFSNSVQNSGVVILSAYSYVLRQWRKRDSQLYQLATVLLLHKAMAYELKEL